MILALETSDGICLLESCVPQLLHCRYQPLTDCSQPRAWQPSIRAEHTLMQLVPEQVYLEQQMLKAIIELII